MMPTPSAAAFPNGAAMNEQRLSLAALVAFVVGVGLMIPFDHPLTLAAGVACLFAFIVLGVFGLVTPDRLAEDGESRGADADRPQSDRST